MSERQLDADSEPAAYEEARGPRLPDFVMALSTTAWVFSLLAIARVIWFVRQWDQPASADAVLTFAANVVPAVGAVVLPAALALRHPDAPHKAPWLFLGTVLIAAVEGMRVLSRPLQPVFEQIAPAAPETPVLVPLAILYSAIAGLLGAVAVWAIGRGLWAARRYADRSSIRPIAGLLASAVIVIAALRLVALWRLDWEGVPITPVVIVYVGSTALLSVFSVAAWAYLAAMAIAGARAGEDPEAGWLLAAMGSAMVLGAFASNGALGLVMATPETTAMWQGIGLIISLGFALGYLAIVVAFLLGLPSLDPVPDDDAVEAMFAEEEGEAMPDDAEAAMPDRAEAGSPDFEGS